MSLDHRLIYVQAELLRTKLMTSNVRELRQLKLELKPLGKLRAQVEAGESACLPRPIDELSGKVIPEVRLLLKLCRACEEAGRRPVEIEEVILNREEEMLLRKLIDYNLVKVEKKLLMVLPSGFEIANIVKKLLPYLSPAYDLELLVRVRRYVNELKNIVVSGRLVELCRDLKTELERDEASIKLDVNLQDYDSLVYLLAVKYLLERLVKAGLIVYTWEKSDRVEARTSPSLRAYVEAMNVETFAKVLLLMIREDVQDSETIRALFLAGIYLSLSK